MSLSEQIQRVVGGHNAALKTLITQLGVDASSAKADELNELAGRTVSIGQFNRYYWRRRLRREGTVQRDIAKNQQISNTSTNQTVRYAEGVTESESGVVLHNPTSVTVSRTAIASTIVNNAPCFFTTNYTEQYYPGVVFYCPEGVTNGSSQSFNDYAGETLWYYSNDYTTSLIASADVKASILTYEWLASEWETLVSDDENAYPHSGIVDGYQYEFFGKPLDHLFSAPTVETGTYVGTGQYGAASKNTIYFTTSVPALVLIASDEAGGLGVFVYPGISGAEIHNSYREDVTWDNGSMTWYNTNAPYAQLNADGRTYTYYVISKGW